MGHERYSDDKLLEEIRRLSRPGDPVTMSEMREDGLYSPRRIHSRFGSWNEALRTAGVGVNRERKYSTKQVLAAIREHADEDARSLSKQEFTDKADISAQTATDHCGSWWKAVVRAGCYPPERRPLTPEQYEKFHEATLDQSDPVGSLIGLLSMFTGIPATMYEHLTSAWFDRVDTDYETVVSIPSDYTESSQSWDFVLPESFTIGGDSHSTRLPEAIEWIIQTSSKQLASDKMRFHQTIRRIARDAKIGLPFTTQEYARTGDTPDVTPNDLRATLGVQMARQGAPRRQIKRHLGIEHTGWDADVEDFFLWLYVHEDFEHPDYDPPDTVLDPV